MASNDKEQSVATELTAGSDSAATERTEEPQLAELVNQEAGLATEIELKVIRNDLVDYTYPLNGQQVPTQKVQIVLQSKVADQYCLGVAKLQRKDKTELKQVQDRWKTGTTWRFKALTLLNDKSHFMPHRNRSAQVAGAGAATEHVFPTSATANSYNRRRIAIDADAAIRSHGHCSQNP